MFYLNQTIDRSPGMITALEMTGSGNYMVIGTSTSKLEVYRRQSSLYHLFQSLTEPVYGVTNVDIS